MKLKNENVSIEKLIPLMVKSLPIIEKACKVIEGESYEMTITSGNDGAHKKGSLHYINRAINIRCKDMKSPIEVVLRIKQRLGRNFDVIYEYNHIHIEYDPK